MLFRGGEGFEAIDRAALELSIPALFESQVQLRGGALAIGGADPVSYRKLGRMVNRCAAALAASTSSTEKPVAILFSQGAALVATILGVLRAGRFYAPIQAGFPDEWIRRALRQLGSDLVICDAANRQTAIKCAGAQNVLCWGDLDPYDDSASLPALPAPDTYAYIYSTSGSTGEPKGVLDNHRNVIHNVRRYVNGLEIGAGDRLTLLQPPGFSGAVSSMFSALLTGACLYPVDSRRLSAQQLADWVTTNRLTMWHSTPSLFRVLASSGASFPLIRVVRLEGDQASQQDVEAFERCFGSNAALVNGLGATECGIVRRYFVERGAQPTGTTVPVGHAVEDVDVQVIDENGAQIFDRAGEVVVRSRFLALGYWGRPDLTAERFLPDPNDPSLRTYHTGDLGLMREDGCLELCGRLDGRFKIRGQWASLEELEAVLSSAPGVAECVAAASQNGHGDTRLVAYFKSSSDPAPTASALRQGLAGKLPDHLTPAVFVELKGLPLTAYGKVDRRALPPPGRSRPSLDVPYEPPKTDLEHLLASAWKSALDLDDIGVDDEFFALGGDSLAALRVVSSQFLSSLEVSVHELWKAGSIRRLAELIERRRTPPLETEIPPDLRSRVEKLDPVRRALLERRLASLRQREPLADKIPVLSDLTDFPLSYAQRRLWFYEQLAPNTSTYSVTSQFRLRGRLEVPVLEDALARLLDRHAALRMTFQTPKPGPFSVSPRILLFRWRDLMLVTTPTLSCNCDRKPRGRSISPNPALHSERF